MDKYKPLLLSLAFVVCAAITFGIVKFVKSDSPKPESNEIVAQNEDYADKSSTIAETASDNNDRNSKGGTDVNTTGTSNETLDKVEKEAEALAQAEAAKAKAEADAKAAAEAKAMAEAAKAKAEAEAKAKAEANKMTAAEFQRILASSDASILGGRNPKVAKSIHITCQGIRDGEKKPGDLVAVRQKVIMDQWISFTVVSVGYDSTGKINSAVIRPNYPD